MAKLIWWLKLPQPWHRQHVAMPADPWPPSQPGDTDAESPVALDA